MIVWLKKVLAKFREYVFQIKLNVYNKNLFQNRFSILPVIFFIYTKSFIAYSFVKGYIIRFL